MTFAGWAATIGVIVVLFAVDPSVLACSGVASMLKARRDPDARAHAGTLRPPREDLGRAQA